MERNILSEFAKIISKVDSVNKLDRISFLMNENIHPKSKEEENYDKTNKEIFKLIDAWFDVIEKKHSKPIQEVLKDQLKNSKLR